VGYHRSQCKLLPKPRRYVLTLGCLGLVSSLHAFANSVVWWLPDKPQYSLLIRFHIGGLPSYS
jgi:hypothetical protein